MTAPYPTGYTKDLPAHVRRMNELKTIKAILREQPTNNYWLNRRDAVFAEMTEAVLDFSELYFIFDRAEMTAADALFSSYPKSTP